MDNLFNDVADTAPTGADTNVTPVDSPVSDSPDTFNLWEEGHPADAGLGQKLEPKNDPKRAEYWQSQADRAKQTLTQREAEFKAQEAKYAELAQLDEYLRQNPQVVQKLRGELGVADSQTADAGLQKPTKPVAPEGYNEVEAFNDPQSASWKHRKAMETYRDNLAEYFEKREEARIAEETQRAQMSQAQAQYQAAIRQTYGILQQQHGLKPDEAQEFVQMFSDDSSITLDNLVKLYRVMKSPAQAPKQPEHITRQVNRSRIPAPISAVNGFQQPEISEEDSFNMGLFQNGGKQRFR